MNECLTTRSPLTQLELLNNGTISFATKLHGMKNISLPDCETKLHLAPRDLNSKTSAIAFSKNGELLAFANSNIIRIFYLPTRKLIKTIRSDEREIEILHFDPSSKYLIAGSKSGRVTQYRYSNSISLSRLCSFEYKQKNSSKIKESFVSSIAFHDTYIACSGYGGSIVVINLHSQIKKAVITNLKSRIDALCFLNAESLVSGNVDGIVEIHSLKNRSTRQKIVTHLTNIKQILPMSNPRFILISSDSNFLIVVDLQTNKIIDSKYMEFEDSINKIALSREDILTVSLQNSKLFSIVLPSTKKLSSLVTHNHLSDAFLLIENNHLLKESKEYKKLEKKYAAILTQTVTALINNNKDIAHSLTKEFRAIPSKREEIVSLFRAFEHFTRFRAIVLEKKYALAYAMCIKYPAFTYTPQYKKMEQVWKTTFADAQRQMILGRGDLAKAILNEYMTTTIKRPLIKFILNHNRQFLEFLKAIEKKEYAKVFILADEDEIFKQIPTYTTLNEEIHRDILQTQELIEAGDINSAKRYLKKFQDIPHLKEEIAELNENCLYIQKLQNVYKENNFKECYTILDNHDSLESTELGRLLNKHWSKLILECELFALKGDIKSIKKTLDDLILISTRKEKIGSLLRVSYHVKIKLLISKKSYKKAEAVIYSYLDTFGLDTEINLIKKRFEKESLMTLAIEDDEIHNIKRDDWFESKFIQNLINS